MNIDHTKRFTVRAARALGKDASLSGAITDAVHSNLAKNAERKDAVMYHTELASPHHLSKVIEGMLSLAENPETAKTLIHDIRTMAHGRKLDTVLNDIVQVATDTLGETVVPASAQVAKMEAEARDPNTCRRIIKHLNNVSRTLGDKMPLELVRIRSLAISVANRVKRENHAAASALFR